VDAAGRVDAADYQTLIGERPGIVSVMLANNETGVVQDIAIAGDSGESGRGLVS
jgi:cysteine desulfurase